jgi:hypothetical protein
MKNSLTVLTFVTVMCPAVLPACAFIEAAGDVEVPADSIPHATFTLMWPDVDKLVGSTLHKDDADPKKPSSLPAGFPATLQSGTLAHVQGLMTIDGECKRTYDQPDAGDPKSPIKNMHIEVINCGIEGRCSDACKDDFGDPFRGMRLWARVQFNLVNADTAAKIHTTLNGQTNPDVLAEIRLKFKQLEFVQNFTDPVTGKTTEQNIDGLFAGYELGAASVYAPGDPSAVNDDTPIVKQRYLASISADTPQRFELDPTSAFSLKLRQSIMTGSEVWIEVYQRLDVAEQNLYAVRMNGGGVKIDFQPEIVISVAKALTGAL